MDSTLTPPPLRFTSSKSGVLVASDVAARGLDLPAVEHIVHYQVPRNSEVSVAIIVWPARKKEPPL